MKSITYSVQGYTGSTALNLENLAQILPTISETKMLHLGNAENISIKLIDADSELKGLSRQEAYEIDKGNTHVAFETLQEIEKLLKKIKNFGFDYSITRTRINVVKKQLSVNLRFRTGDLDDCSDTLESDGIVRFDILSDGSLVLDSDSIASTTVSLYAGLDMLCEPDYKSVVYHNQLGDFIQGFDQDNRSDVSSLMVKFIETEFKRSIINNGNHVLKIVKSEIIEA